MRGCCRSLHVLKVYNKIFTEKSYGRKNWQNAFYDLHSAQLFLHFHFLLIHFSFCSQETSSLFLLLVGSMRILCFFSHFSLYLLPLYYKTFIIFKYHRISRNWLKEKTNKKKEGKKLISVKSKPWRWNFLLHKREKRGSSFIVL